MKICIVSSCGGHLTEIRTLEKVYKKFDYFFVLNHHISLPGDMENKTYFIRHSERDWKFFLNLWEAWVIIRKERPNIILSAGAGPVVPFALVGKLFRVRTIFIETFARVTSPSFSGRLMYFLADKFFYQWEALKKFYPKGVYGGPLV